MEAIVSALKEELRQATALMARYEKELQSLPVGTFFTRKIGKQRYGYITRSDGGKVSQHYLGKLDQQAIAKYEEQMKRKRQLGRLLKMAKAQKTFLEKAIRHARKKG